MLLLLGEKQRSEGDGEAAAAEENHRDDLDVDFHHRRPWWSMDLVDLVDPEEEEEEEEEEEKGMGLQGGGGRGGGERSGGGKERQGVAGPSLDLLGGGGGQLCDHTPGHDTQPGRSVGLVWTQEESKP